MWPLPGRMKLSIGSKDGRAESLMWRLGIIITHVIRRFPGLGGLPMIASTKAKAFPMAIRILKW